MSSTIDLHSGSYSEHAPIASITVISVAALSCQTHLDSFGPIKTQVAVFGSRAQKSSFIAHTFRVTRNEPVSPLVPGTILFLTSHPNHLPGFRPTDTRVALNCPAIRFPIQWPHSRTSPPSSSCNLDRIRGIYHLALTSRHLDQLLDSTLLSRYNAAWVTTVSYLEHRGLQLSVQNKLRSVGTG